MLHFFEGFEVTFQREVNNVFIQLHSNLGGVRMKLKINNPFFLFSKAVNVIPTACSLHVFVNYQICSGFFRLVLITFIL